MAISLSTAARNGGAKGVTDVVDAGTGPGRLRIYTGAKPASPNDAATGTLLADVTLADPAFVAGAAGVRTLTDPAAVNGVAAGNAGWFRVLDSDLNAVLDGTVTATGGGGDLTLANVNIAVGQPVDISAGGTITMPAS